ncbi:MAG TPA: FliH/SctL family protein [Candidatus Baltobacteraceae bacterium]|nr:FliH/SctL family protein [Candidatus Baltobacteraceae bacterium]
MANEFRSFAELLAPREAPVPDVRFVEPVLPSPEPACSHDAEALRECRLFHARVEELVERRAAHLLEEIAEIVLARELESAPPALEKIVRRALLRLAAEEPMRVRVNAADLESVVYLGVPAVADPQLQRGDAVIDVRDGEIDLSLASRLQSVIQAWQP